MGGGFYKILNKNNPAPRAITNNVANFSNKIKGPGFNKADTQKDPYTVLNIPRNASQEDIKKAYKQLANKYHPDKVLHLGDEFKKMAEERFKEIQQAYRELTSK